MLLLVYSHERADESTSHQSSGNFTGYLTAVELILKWECWCTRFHVDWLPRRPILTRQDWCRLVSEVNIGRRLRSTNAPTFVVLYGQILIKKYLESELFLVEETNRLIWPRFIQSGFKHMNSSGWHNKFMIANSIAWSLGLSSVQTVRPSVCRLHACTVHWPPTSSIYVWQGDLLSYHIISYHLDLLWRPPPIRSSEAPYNVHTVQLTV